MQIDRALVQLFKRRVGIKPRSNFIRRRRVFTHDEQQRVFAAFRPFLTALPPAFIAQLQVHLVLPGGIIGRLINQLSGFSNDRSLHNARVHRFAQRRVANDVFEIVRLVVFGRRREIELRRQVSAGALPDAFMQKLDCFVPC